MNKTAIKNFAIWARNKLIADITYKAGLLGITGKDINSPLPQSTQTVQFFDIGTKEPSSITGYEIEQRKKLVEEIQRKAKQSDFSTAYINVIEEVAYTWFNRLIAIRFMEVNDYLPTRIRVLSSEGKGKSEPDLVTHAIEANLDYSAYEKDRITQLKYENKLDELFRMLFIKQCNALNANLPELFEKTSDYTELLLNVSFTDKEGVVYHLVNDITEDDFNVSKEGQVEIIGWLYQYYNTEPKDETFALLKKNVKITRERIPAATQLFTPDWIVRYMVVNSLGRLWMESHQNNTLRANWNYYLDEAEQTPEVVEHLRVLYTENAVKSPEDIKVIDPCMGSGHILVYAFEVLMQIYTSEGYSERDAAKLIIEKNLYGLEIDRRAYQLAYFALMMKARQYNRRILTFSLRPQVYEPTGYEDGMEYGSLVRVDNLERMPEHAIEKQMTMFDGNYDIKLNAWNFRRLLAQKYDVVVTNPPYMGSGGMSGKMASFIDSNYTDGKADLFAAFLLRCFELAKQNGMVGLMTSYTWMFLSGYQSIRETVIYSHTLMSLIQPEYHSFFEEAYVPICTFTARKANTHESSIYIRLEQFTGASIQSLKALEAIANVNCKYRYVFNPEVLHVVPGSPLVYWANSSIFEQYKTCPLIQDICPPKPGLSTGENDRFLRFWQEVSFERISFEGLSRHKWYPINKGGEFRRWYGNHQFIVNWENDGFEIRNFKEKGGRLKSRPQNLQWNFKPTISWSLITTGAISLRYYPEYFMQNAAGICCYPTEEKLAYMLAFMNTKPAQLYASLLSPTMNTNAGDIARIPVVYDSTRVIEIENIVNNNIALSVADWDAFETSWDFKRHPLICGERTITAAFKKFISETTERFSTLKANEEELNRIFIDIYGFQDELTSEVEDKDVTVRRAEPSREIRSLISYAVGCMLGRYSLDCDGLAFAGGKWDTGKYKTVIADKDNIIPICDEEYFYDDIVGRFIAFVKVVFSEDTLEENLKFIADALGGKGSPREVIQYYFLNDFYNDHLKIYQKRPVYWLFDCGKQNGFKALVYMHRYDENTIGNLRIDYLHRMQRIYENEIARMQDTIENSKDAREVTAATKRKEKLIKQLQETREYDEKIAHLALTRTSIDLDDGVKVNYEKVQTDTDGKKLDVLAKI